MLSHAGQKSDCGQTTGGPRRGFRRILRPAGSLLFVLFFVDAAAAQTQKLALPAVIEFDHDGVGVKGFVLYATRREDGAERRIDVGMPVRIRSGRWQLSLPALEKGTWQLDLAAYNSAGESPRTQADPHVVRIDPRKIQPAPPVSSSKQKPPPPPKKKKSAVGKLWGVIVGEDKP